MKQLEIEFKNLLTDKEFQMLVEKFKISDNQFYKQTNYYFDTADFQLKKLQSALRIREKGGTFELTLKQPTTDGVGLLETNKNISEQAARKYLANGIVADELTNIGEPMVCFGTLTTKRAEINYKGGILTFDISHYAGQTDYELEYEVSDFEKGKQIFDALLSSVGIIVKPTANKLQRLASALL